MKTVFKFAVLIPLFVSGCAAQKGAKARSEMLYAQALEALESHRFVIRVGEAQGTFFHDPTEVMDAPESYIRMHGNSAMFRFRPELFPYSELGQLRVEDKAAEMMEVKIKKNGDAQFRLRINGEETWSQNEFLITLYHNTNECFVEVDHGRRGMFGKRKALSFRGKVYPLLE